MATHAPIVGNLLDLRNDRVGFQSRVYAECGDLGTFKLGPVTAVMTSSAELAAQVLVESDLSFRKSPGLRVFMRPLLGDGLLSSEHEVHKKQRKLMSSAFQHRRIAGYAKVMAEYGERSMGAWKEGQTIDISDEMMRLTLAIVGKTLFDADVEAEARDVGKAMEVAMRFTMKQLSSLLHFPLWVPTPANLQLKKAIEGLDKVIYRIIEDRRASKKDTGDVLSMLLLATDEEDGSGMSNLQVRDEAMTLFLAGHETTSNALTWTTWLLAENPAVRAKVEEEVDRVVGERLPTFEDLPSLPYTMQVLQESMRLYPPAYMVGREALQDVEIGGYRIPKGTIIFVNIWAMHRRDDVFPDPLRFDPDRFKPEAMKKLPRSAYIPFGAGSRICIGNHFALMEAQILLATLVRKFRLELVPGQTIGLDPLITLRPKGGIAMRVEKRSARRAEEPRPAAQAQA